MLTVEQAPEVHGKTTQKQKVSLLGVLFLPRNVKPNSGRGGTGKLSNTVVHDKSCDQIVKLHRVGSEYSL